MKSSSTPRAFDLLPGAGVVVVGAGGTILHSSSGLNWEVQVSETSHNLYAVWASTASTASTANDVFAGVTGFWRAATRPACHGSGR